jgi:TFIIF-interacting CTD phosphatase-like protein
MHGTKVRLRALRGVDFLENAIPIEGWISDPTDNDLLHLIPFLRALRFVGDVRNLLGMRSGVRKR